MEGSEEADRRAKDTVMRGQWMWEPSLATPAGIRQAYPLLYRAAHPKWDRNELRGLTYLHADKGPQRAWQHQIGRAEDPFCGYGEIQNAAHLLESGCMAAKRRKWEDIWTDRIFCAEVASFLESGGGEGGNA